ncbi:P-loop containing nucleoside triphosphate hydrolase protein [Rostrohypoxylon terebratum]|nr:P-loop containing nucleoside triphosphate hydrolase protein [Rostrohypoxylon terebratum]
MSSFKKLFKRSSRHASSSIPQSSSTAATEWPVGLDVVYDSPEASLDIVAIHGLNGHREKTWTADNGVHWLRDLLPKDLPTVRILTWGYDANTHASDRVSCQYLYDHALDLVADLTRKRTLTESTERPIIFVAHSLGGIVVKSALIHSDAARQGAQYEHRSVKTSTYGILFMGTPHQGGNGVQLGRALVNIASIFVAADDRILKHLERDSEWLQQQLGQYGTISSEFVTKFAYETYKTHTQLGHKILVVPRASAVVPGQADAEAIGIHSDHTRMIKFSSTDDGGYKKVSENLQIMARSAGETVRSRWETEARVDTARRNDVTSFELPLNLSQVTDVPRFVAREDELRRMHEVLGEGGERRTAILHGLGGMGKTQLAREYIKRHRKHFSAVIWLNARDTTSLQQSFMQAARQIHQHYSSIMYVRNAVQSRDLDEGVDAVKQWLEEPANNKWLVVYDNYDNPKFGVAKNIHRRSNRDASGTMLADERKQTAAPGEDLTQQAFDIRPFLPGTYHGAVVVTTRSAEVELGTYIRVKKLTDPKSCLEILASTSYRQGVDQDEAARTLVQRLDGLPLALVTAGAYLKGVPSTTFADYLTLYEASWRQLQESSPKILSYVDRALYSTWNISFTHIQHQNPASAMLLRLWAYFDNEDLWYELLREGLSSNRKKYVHGIVADKIRFDGAIRVLYNHGLVEADELMRERGGESQGYSMHGCVHSWTQHVLNEEENEESIKMAGVARECVGRHVPGRDAYFMRIKVGWQMQKQCISGH